MDKNEQHKVLVERLKTFIQQNNITINKLAKNANLKQSTVNGIINDGRIPSLPTLLAIAEALNISVTEFLDIPPYNKKSALVDASQN